MTEAKKKNIYPSMILLLLGSFLIFSVWSALQASRFGSEVTDADYYSKGLKYNTSQVEKQAAESLGWSIETKLNGRALEFHLTDREGSEVDRAVGTLYLAIPDRAENIHLSLQEVAAGYYRVDLGDNLNGTIQARLELTRDGARLNRHLLLNL